MFGETMDLAIWLNGGSKMPKLKQDYHNHIAAIHRILMMNTNHVKTRTGLWKWDNLSKQLETALRYEMQNAET